LSKHVVVIRGEDTSPEAVDPSVALMRALSLPIDWSIAAVGEEAVRRHGAAFPAEVRELIDNSDATLFGATSGASSGALFYLRWGKETFANVRPARWVKGMNSPLAHPERVDFVIVRENLEDLYLFAEGDLPGKFAIKAITEMGSERIARFAFRLAQERKAKGHPGLVSCGTKHNMLPQSDGLFRRVAERVSQEFHDIEFESFIVDDLAHRLVGDSGHFDVVVLPNLYGDILSDAAAGLAGGLGLAPSGCYGESYAYFESAHGTAPDIAGKNIINPTATLLSGAMMLDYLGFGAAASGLRSAIERVYEKAQVLTPDQGGSASTTEFCSAVESEL